eukprot:8209005-Alexandrium_andersonii.AAC.1
MADRRTLSSDPVLEGSEVAPSVHEAFTAGVAEVIGARAGKAAPATPRAKPTPKPTAAPPS